MKILLAACLLVTILLTTSCNRPSGLVETQATDEIPPGAPATAAVLTFGAAIQLQEGRCCIGGRVGSEQNLMVSLTAQSPFGAVTRMRLYMGGACVGEDVLSAQPWVPFTSSMQLPLKIATVNWVGYYVSAQLEDAQGNLSAVVCDDISVEGMP